MQAMNYHYPKHYPSDMASSGRNYANYLLDPDELIVQHY
jgi:hypothetical protein